jgi:hypothetical protein
MFKLRVPTDKVMATERLLNSLSFDFDRDENTFTIDGDDETIDLLRTVYHAGLEDGKDS